MLLVKRDEISLREFIVTTHQFQLERRIEKKRVKEPYEGFEKYHLPTACRFYSLEERKEKSFCLCARYLLIDPRYQQQGSWRRTLSISDFWLRTSSLLVIKPPWTYFNNELLHSCRSLKFSSLLPAFFCVLRWIQFVLLKIQRVTAKCFNFSQTNIVFKVAKSHSISYQIVFQPDSFSNNLNWIYVGFYVTRQAQLSRKIPSMDDRIWTFL